MPTRPTNYQISILLVTLFILLRLWRLTSYGLNVDEIFSYQAAQLGWGGLMRTAAADIVHPPLFYILLKCWIAIGGHSLLWLKLFPVITSIATLLFFWPFCRELMLTNAETSTALFLISVNAFLIHYSQELRMYSLLIFFSLWSYWLYVRLVNGAARNGRLFAGLFLVNLLLIYTHYFGWLVIGAEGLYLLLRRREYLAVFSITSAALAVCFAPWAYEAFLAAARSGMEHNLAWIPPPRLAELAWYFAMLNGVFHIRWTTALGLMLFGFPLVIWLWDLYKGLKDPRNTSFLILAFLSFVPVVLSFGINYSLPRPVWVDRFLIGHAIPYLILVALAAYRLRPKWVKVLTLLLIISWAGLSSVYRLRHDNSTFNWFAVAGHIRKAEPAETGPIMVYTLNGNVAVPIRSSLEFLGERRFEVTRVKDMKALGRGHFWVIIQEDRLTSNRLLQDFQRDTGCQVGQAFSVVPFRGDLFVGQPVTAWPVSCGP
jgi:uncharacterized membrane protein